MLRLLFVFLLAVGAVLADGGMIGPPGAWVEEIGQVAVLTHFDGVERLALSTAFSTGSNRFAWIVPMPARPEVDGIDQELFTALKEHTRSLVRNRGGFGCGPGFWSRDELAEGGNGLEEIEGGVIGDFEYQVLYVTEADTLVRYLEGYGFEVPEGADSILEHYLDKSWNWFTVARVARDTTRSGLGNLGIRLTFATDAPVYPLYISRLGGYDPQQIVLYVAARHRQECDDAVLLFSGSLDAGTFPEHPGFVDRACRLTKLYYEEWYPEEFEDIVFRDAPDDNDYRYIEYADASLLLPWSLFAFAAVLAFRRRRRAAGGTD